MTLRQLLATIDTLHELQGVDHEWVKNARAAIEGHLAIAASVRTEIGVLAAGATPQTADALRHLAERLASD